MPLASEGGQDDDRGRALVPRSVSQWGAIGQTLAIGAIFGVGFLAGTVAVFAGFTTPLSVLLAGLGTLALAYVLTLYGRRFAGAGAVYEYLGRGGAFVGRDRRRGHVRDGVAVPRRRWRLRRRGVPGQ